MLLAVVVLVISQAAVASQCVELARTPATAGGAAYVVRACIEEAEPGYRVTAADLAEGSDPYHRIFVEYGIVDRGRELGFHVLLDTEFDEPSSCPIEVYAPLYGGPATPAKLRRALVPALRRCLVAEAPRVLAFSTSGASLALHWPRVGDDGTLPLRNDVLVNAHTGDVVVAGERFLGFRDDRGRLAFTWPRGCLPLTLDEVASVPFFPLCVVDAPTERVRLVAVVDVPAGALAGTEVPVVADSATATARDPFAERTRLTPPPAKP